MTTRRIRGSSFWVLLCGVVPVCPLMAHFLIHLGEIRLVTMQLRLYMVRFLMTSTDEILSELGSPFVD
jgi:hypothetical protein